MAKLLCWLLGHDWMPCQNIAHIFSAKPHQVRSCRRCDRMERRV